MYIQYWQDYLLQLPFARHTFIHLQSSKRATNVGAGKASQNCFTQKFGSLKLHKRKFVKSRTWKCKVVAALPDASWEYT